MNGLGSFIMKIIAYKGRPFSVFVDGFVFHIEVESNDGSHLESLDALGTGRRIFKKCALAR